MLLSICQYIQFLHIALIHNILYMLKAKAKIEENSEVKKKILNYKNVKKLFDKYKMENV